MDGNAMQSNAINIGLAFLEGIALIASPCIFPILPLILSNSLTGSKLKPLGIITGFVLTFTLATLASRSIINFFHLDPALLQTLSYAMLSILGLWMLFPFLSDKLTVLLEKFFPNSSLFNPTVTKNSGFLTGFLIGALISLIWTPCAGPILAAVIVQVAVQETNLLGALVLLAFAIGTGLPMLMIATLGRDFIQHFRFINKHAILFRQILGMIILLTVLFLYFNNGTLTFSQQEFANDKHSGIDGKALQNAIGYPYMAPELQGGTTWLNSPPLFISQLKGKVVLIDFWTYSCINCIRTLPFLLQLDAKYRKQGLIIIGVHSPEFQFEQVLANVENAVKKYGIQYPVVLDNQFKIWRRYQNSFWPAHYLINKNGTVVYIHFGEGQYDVLENNIRYLLNLGETKNTISMPKTARNPQTPETYLGYARANRFASPEKISFDQINKYSYPTELALNYWALKGQWIIESEKIICAQNGAKLQLHLRAGKVFAVMNSQNHKQKVSLNWERNPVENKQLETKTIEVSTPQLYELFAWQHSEAGILEISCLKPGLEIYTFTFGNT